MKKIMNSFMISATIVSALLTVGCSKKQVTITSAQDLSDKKIGVVSGFTGEMWCQENLPNANLSSFKSGMDAALDLKNGAVDAVVIDELPAKEIVARNKDLTIVFDDFATEEYSIAVKKGNTELLSLIDGTIENMKKTGEYTALVNAFMPADGNIKVPGSVAISGSDDVLVMGTNAAFPPFEYMKGTKIVGFDVTMSETIARDADMSLKVVDMAFDSLIGALQAGQVDFVAAGMSVTPERKKNVDFSLPYYSSKQVIIVRNK